MSVLLLPHTFAAKIAIWTNSLCLPHSSTHSTRRFCGGFRRIVRTTGYFPETIKKTGVLESIFFHQIRPNRLLGVQTAPDWHPHRPSSVCPLCGLLRRGWLSSYSTNASSSVSGTRARSTSPSLAERDGERYSTGPHSEIPPVLGTNFTLCKYRRWQ